MREVLFFKFIKKFNKSYQHLGLKYSKLIVMFVLMLVTSVLEMSGLLLLYPLILLLSHNHEHARQIILSFLPHSMYFMNLILFLFAAVSLLYILKNIVLYFTFQNNINFAMYYYRNIICELYNVYVHKPLLDFKEESSGSFANIVCVQTERLIDGVLRPLLIVITEFFIFLGIAIIVLLLISPWMIAIVLSSCAGAIGLYYALFKTKAMRWGKERMLAKATLLEWVNNTAIGISEIKIFGKEEYLTNKIHETSLVETKMFHHWDMFRQAPRYLMETVFIVSFLSCFAIDLLIGANSAILLAKFSVVAAASFRILPTINRLVCSFSNVTFNLEPAFAVLDTLTTIENPKASQFETSSSHRVFETKKIELKNVSFKYPLGEKVTLNAINLFMLHGQRVGLVGASGSGKSTLIKLLAGLYAPISGEILVDGRPINDALKSWQRNIGYVPQESFIMPGSIKENIAFGREDLPSDTEVRDILAEVGLMTFVSSLSEEIHTKIGEKGITLSGGQKQLICLARALFRNPKVLLLDEPTASLDVDNEQLVLNTIYDLSSSATIVMSSHKLENFKNFDTIYHFHDGQISIQTLPSYKEQCVL